MCHTRRIWTAVGAVAIAIVAYYWYKHGHLGSPTEMANEAAKDAKDAAKGAGPK